MKSIFSKLSEDDIADIKRIKENPRLYDDLAESLFSQIYGHI